MLIKFSSKDTEHLCKLLYKLENYNTSKLLSRYAEIPSSMRQHARILREDLKQKGMTQLNMETLNLLLWVVRGMAGVFYDTALESKIRNIKYNYEDGCCRTNFKTENGESVVLVS